MKVSWEFQVGSSIRKLVRTLSAEMNCADQLSFSFGKSVALFVLNADFLGSLSALDHGDNPCN